MRRFLQDRRAVSSFEYALLAATIGLVLLEVLQTPAESNGNAIMNFYHAWGGHGSTG